MLRVGKKCLIYVLFLTLILAVAGFTQIKKVKADITQSGTSSGQFPPANFGVDISTYNMYKDSSGNPTGDPKVTFYWAGAQGVLDNVDSSGNKYTPDQLEWDLNVYKTSVNPPEHIYDKNAVIHSGATWTGTYDTHNKDGSGYSDYVQSDFQWGSINTFSAQLDLRVQATGNNIGTANITFSMPDQPPSITSTSAGTGECPVQNIKAYPETNAYGNQEAVIHFSWEYNKDPKCKDINHGVFLTNPNNKPINQGIGIDAGWVTGRYATDTKGMKGVYTFCTVEHFNAGALAIQECHGINTINVDKFELEGVSITGNADINEKGGPGGKGTQETCGVSIGSSIFAQAIGGALCGLIQLIGNFTAWVMEHIYGTVFNA